MKKQITKTVALWAFYGFTLWFCFGAFGLPRDFMPMLWAGLLSSLVLGLALWNTFVLYGLNLIEQEKQDKAFGDWVKSLRDDYTWDVTIPAPNGFEFIIFWNGALTMWQAELWDVTTKPYGVVDRDMFITKDEAIDWFVDKSKILDTF